MRIEIRKSGGTPCETCGAQELIHVPDLNRYLEADLLELFSQKIPWWRWLRRRRFAHFRREVERVAGELRSLTRY